VGQVVGLSGLANGLSLLTTGSGFGLPGSETGGPLTANIELIKARGIQLYNKHSDLLVPKCVNES